MSRALARSQRPSPVAVPAPLPYGMHVVDEDDIAAVVAALRSNLLAQGPRVAAFEDAFAETIGAVDAVACSCGTAALHLALAGLDVGPGDTCIVPAITFVATATAARFLDAEVVFCDVDPESGLATPATVERAVERAGSVKAVLPVHLAGRVCDVPGIVAAAPGAAIVEDSCHALGSIDRLGLHVGACTDSAAATFSFHPVKTIASGEGGMVAVQDRALAKRLRRLRNHGVTREAQEMTLGASFSAPGRPNPWSYEQLELGFNYRMNEMEAALGLSQLGKLNAFVTRRRALSARYDRLLAPLVRTTTVPAGQTPAPHLYTVLIDFPAAGMERADVMRALADKGVGTQVHYIPVYRQPYFRDRYGDMRLPGAEAYYARVLSLPLFPAMADEDVERVVEALVEVLWG